MKLRWIDSKSKQMREVFIDLPAIMNQRASALAPAESCLSPFLPTATQEQASPPPTPLPSQTTRLDPRREFRPRGM